MLLVDPLQAQQVRAELGSGPAFRWAPAKAGARNCCMAKERDLGAMGSCSSRLRSPRRAQAWVRRRLEAEAARSHGVYPTNPPLTAPIRPAAAAQRALALVSEA